MKKVIKAAFVIAFVAIAGYGITSLKTEHISDLTLANVEALATSEWEGDCLGCRFDCFLICYTYGDWGACLGQWDGTTHFC